ncbi:hypothetical protein Rhe02_73270 [Rhizocola hellebori]|uniref:Transcription regulator PadR N-terminal domain-containing protein n=1 Tax=Rhizocola hellebori TaxID=1392758 RepID=A0A8J3QGG4_9ACTN|nr:helix-turn-helix transcriptional regulator [Rhizocola hellebori]GIH09260.1 hypothetical protein Rhe02_73270 [Rhizocola hellebori]
MSGPPVVTGPMLEVLAVLLEAFTAQEQPHGWAIVKATRRSGPTVYDALDRLEDAGWVTARWEDPLPGTVKARRRFYTLTPTARAEAMALVGEMRQARSVLGSNPLPGTA